MKKLPYIWWKALAYELALALMNKDNDWRKNKWIQLIQKDFFNDWVEFRAAREMITVDEQVSRLMKEIDWKEYEKEKFIFTEKSKGKTPLGGEMRWASSFNEDEKLY